MTVIHDRGPGGERRRAGAHRSRVPRRVVVACLAVVCTTLVLGAGGSAGAAVRSRSPRDELDALEAATPAFRTYVTTVGTAGHRSFTLTQTAAGIYGAISFDTGPHTGLVRIARYRDGRWAPVTTLPLEGVSIGQAGTPIRADRLTGSRFPEFRVVVALGDSYGLQEVTAAGGHWRLLHFLGPSPEFGGADVVGHVELGSSAGRSLTVQWQDCTPTCADGTVHATVFRYAPGRRQLAASTGPATLTLSEVDNGRDAVVHAGDTVAVVLHRTYWSFDAPSDTAVMKLTGEPVVVGDLRGCFPGEGCGTVTAQYLAATPGVSQLNAHRSTCGEALQCPPDERTWLAKVTVT